ncbi:unconventional myosin IC-like [Penaeus indicus]|uniref:unconventional myosin IC-like n=1 Tax=Penaeus indicus TaxID=29960 RepID=UPI00300CB46A
MSGGHQALVRMESVLEDRERYGVPDAILLEDYQNEAVFIDNLKKRYHENVIYTYIGQVLVSVNPYKDLGLYTDALLEKYRNVNFYEVPPHVFAITENAYRTMTSEVADHCILISGESGAGKTEASKQVLRFLAATSLHRREIDRVRDRLLQSNPLLEAFGNAKTNRNDNSSRFGKYMDIEFNFKVRRGGAGRGSCGSLCLGLSCQPCQRPGLGLSCQPCQRPGLRYSCQPCQRPGL